MIWCHDSGKVVKTIPCDTFQGVCNQLNQAVPNSVIHSSSLFKVLYGKRVKIYGWKLSMMVIRSEAEDGL